MWLVLLFSGFVTQACSESLPLTSGCKHDICVYQTPNIGARECAEIIAHANNGWPIQISTIPQWSAWDELLFQAFGDAMKRYHSPYDAAIFEDAPQDAGYTLLHRTEANGTMHIHIDAPQARLRVGAVLFLDARVGGGAWEWPRQSVYVEPACGRMVLFPNTYTHPKVLRAIVAGSMCYIVTWFISRA